MYDKPLIDVHQLAEQIAGTDPAVGSLTGAGGYRMAMVVCFLVGTMLALVTTRAVTPATSCSPPHVTTTAQDPRQ